jgi:hypothetical protein
MSKIICITSSSISKNYRMNNLAKFTTLGFLNFAFVYELPNGFIAYEIINAQLNLVAKILNPKSSTEVFPDKLKDLTGFEYKIVLFPEPPSIYIHDNIIKSYMLDFLNILKDIQNATIKIDVLYSHKNFTAQWKRRGYHLFLNKGYSTNAVDPKLMNYDKKSYCALVPIRKKSTYLQIIIMEPFDILTWVLFGLSIVTSVAVWWMYRSRGAVNSHWQLAAGIFMMFIGQGADFSRHNRFVLAVLLNIICLSVFLLSNLYEGAITSYMIEPAHETRLKTVDDLVASNYEIKSTKAFTNLHKNLTFLKLIASRLNSNNEPIQHVDIIERRHVFIRFCDFAESLINKRFMNGRALSDYYYILPEQLTWTFVRLEASYLNPFVARFQYYMDLSFQAGLPHMWKVFEHQDHSEVKFNGIEDGDELLKLKDLLIIFRISVVGFGFAFVVLLIEVFCHDCLSNLNINEIIRNKILKLFKKPNQTIVRTVFVQPRHH